MCGITGWVEPGGAPIDERAILAMTRTLAHRGPDGEGIHVEPGCGLGHRRLALIDRRTGAQPVASESGDIRVVANNEIYNYLELRDELRARGHRLRTASDTETIVHLYEDFGASCVDHMVGMFAFAVWDRRTRTLLLARDRFGVKPLYYFEDGRGGLRFASELRALLAVPGIDRSLDPIALHNYLRDLTLPEPASILQQVRKLPPGHVLLWRDGAVRIAPYWRLPDRCATAAPCDATSGGDTDHEDEIERALLESTKLTMRSDEPVGLFLSGGLDSSLLAWAMRRCGASTLRTFSVAFGEPTFDESSYSRSVAEAFASQHHELRVTREDATEAALKLTTWFDEPFADSSAIPTYLLSLHASREVKAVLTGEGADELFAGSHWHHGNAGEEPGFGELLAPPPKTVFSQSDLTALLHPELAAGGNIVPDAIAAMPAHLDGLHRRLFVDLNLYLPSDLLTKIDRMSMLCSLEARVPYLNHPFAERVWSLPSRCKIDGQTHKALLRAIGRRHLPRAIVDRRKQGFAIPLDIWLWQEGRFRDVVYDTLRDPRCKSRGLIDSTVVDTMLEDHHRARRMNGHGLWTLFVLERWLQQYHDGDQQPAPPATPRW